MSAAKVLIVDDLSMIRVSLKCLISECGKLAVGEVANIGQAKDWLSCPENIKGLKAIFCDWKCEDGSILDLMKYVKAQNWSVPIYCLAPDSESALVKEARRQGAHGELQRPFHRAQMAQLHPLFKTDAA